MVFLGACGNKIRMKPNLLCYAMNEVPRYTSYPTAVHFHDGIDETCARKWLSELPANAPVSLYAHIPFCEKMCWYCGCHTNIVQKPDIISAYVDDLCTEISVLAAALPGSIGAVHHLHFGGGSPSMLSGKQFTAIMQCYRAGFSFAENAQIAIEIDPRTMDQKLAKTYAKCGVTRASLGVQDFNAHVQEKINRIQPTEMVRAVNDWLRDAGVSSINFDLIYGLPGQGLGDISRTLDTALSMQPDRFAVFGYAHVPWFKKHQKMIKDADLPDIHQRFAQANLVAKTLVHTGYVRIGFDHYAKSHDALAVAVKENRLRRNFQGYTDDECDILLGVGASSISALPGGYVQNNPHMGRWRQSVRRGHLPIARGIALDEPARFYRAAILQILSQGKVDLAAHCAAFGRADTELDEVLVRLQPLAQDGLVQIIGKTVQILPAGLPFSRNVAACFDPNWQAKSNQHSLAI